MNIFFLGAGFSQPAGLPLGDGLFLQVLEEAKSRGMYYRGLEYHVKEYLDYYCAKTGKEVTEDQIKLEEFMSYLDINRELMLLGGDYTAPEKDFKNLIAYVIHSHQTRITDDKFTLYEHFAERMSPDDIIFTFNYDTVLENALARVNKPYRLYQFRRRFDERTNALVLDWKREIVIYKMHGSINWFDKSLFQEWKDEWAQKNYHEKPPFAVFDGRIRGKVRRLLDEPFEPNDPLKNIYIVENLDEYFDMYFSRDEFMMSDCPLIIAPSHHKLTSLGYLANFWYRFSNSIIGANRISIIGFSLPAHDEYIRQPMYWYIRNFQKLGEPIEGTKSKLKIVDVRTNQKDINELKANYRFVEGNRTDFYLGGFGEAALDFIFTGE